MPSNGPDVIVWIIASIPLILSLGLFVSLIKKSRQISSILKIIERYDLVHQSIDDFMETASIYLPAVVNQMASSIEHVKSMALTDPNYAQNLSSKIETLNELARSINLENDNSMQRAESKPPTLLGDTPNPFKSLYYLITLVVVLALEAVINYAFATTLPPPIVAGATILTLGLFSLIYLEHGKIYSKYKKVASYASQTVSLFNGRREFIDDSGSHIIKKHLELMQASQLLTSIPQARGFFTGLVGLAKIGHSIATIERASNMEEDAPLFSAGIALNKLINKRYAPAAKERHLQLSAKLEENFAFQIFPKDFVEIMDQLASNAITFSKPGDKIVFASRQQKDKVIITITDNGVGINSDKLLYLFKPRQIANSDLDQEFKVSLGLQICKVIACRFGGELKIASKEGKGSVVTLIAPRKVTQMKLNIPRHVSVSVGALD